MARLIITEILSSLMKSKQLSHMLRLHIHMYSAHDAERQLNNIIFKPQQPQNPLSLRKNTMHYKIIFNVLIWVNPC